MIGGAALGAFIVGNDGKTIRATFKVLPTLFHHSKKHDKALCMELLALFCMCCWPKAQGRHAGAGVGR